MWRYEHWTYSFIHVHSFYYQKRWPKTQCSLLSRIPTSRQFGDNFWSPIKMTAVTLLFIFPNHAPNHIDQLFRLQLESYFLPSLWTCLRFVSLWYIPSTTLKYQPQLADHFYASALYYIPTLKYETIWSHFKLHSCHPRVQEHIPGCCIAISSDI